MSEQLGLEGMPQKLVKVTPSKLASFSACRLRYRMTYLDRPSPPRGGAWAHSTLGAVVHNALRTLLVAAPAERTPARARQEVARAWSGEGFADAAQQHTWRRRAQDWVDAYVTEADVASVEAVGLERWVAAPLGSIVVEGRVDRIDARASTDPAESTELVVVDYKTGRRPLSEDDARLSPALALYALAARRTLRRSCRRVELHHLPTGEVHGFDHTADTLDAALQRAQRQAAEISDATESLTAGGDPAGLFPANPGPQCSWCVVRRSCPTGRDAAPELAPWAGLGR